MKCDTIFSDYITSIAFSPDKKSMAISNQYIHFFDLTNFQEYKTFKTDLVDLASLAYSPDSKYIAGVNYRQIYLWNIETGVRIFLSPDMLLDYFSVVQFSPDGKYIVAANRIGPILILDPKDLSIIDTLYYDNVNIFDMAISPDSRFIALTSWWQGQIGIINTYLMKFIKFIETNRIGLLSSVRFSADGTKLACSHDNGVVYIFNLGAYLSIADETISKDGISISPNPATDFLEISYPGIDRMVNHTVDEANHTLKGVVNSEIAIYNVFGEKIPPRLISSATPQEWNLRLDVSGLSPGVYFLKVGEKVGKFLKL